MKQLLRLFVPLFFLTHNFIQAQCSFTTSIAVSGPTVTCGNLTLTAQASGDVWTPKANFAGGARNYAVGFSIGNKGYLGTGGSSNDFWEYDPSTNVWTQKANFAGSARNGAVGFSIGNKGYIGTGNDPVNGKRDDFWEYDPLTNTWSQKAKVGGKPRCFAVGFSIGNKGYIGTGDGHNGFKKDFWEYNPTTNTWTQKADVPGGYRSGAMGFGIGNKGYIGLGSTINAAISYSLSGYQNDFYEYDPSTDSWKQKVSPGISPIDGVIPFTIGANGYFVGGIERDHAGNGATFSGKLWQYDQARDTWVQKASIGVANGRYVGCGFAIGNRAYIGTGYYTSTLNTFWEYEGPGNYVWSNGATSAAITVTASGNYSVLHTNGAGCTATAVQAVAISPNPTIAVSGTNTSCAGISNTLVASGATSYTWSANAGGGNSASVILSPTAPSIYNVAGSTGSCIVNYPITLFASSTPIASISVSGSTLGCGPRTLSAMPAGNVWNQKSSYGSVNRVNAVACAVGVKAYMGTGSYLNDWWEFDPSANTWTQKASLPASGRNSAIAFTIGDKAYLGLGNLGASGSNAFYEYNPSNNTWTQKANFAGGVRYNACGFSIGNKGYIGTGYDYTTGLYFQDFWEYNPITDTWARKADFNGGPRKGAVSFVVGSKGYLGTGTGEDGNPRSDFWEYNQALDKWTQISNYAGGKGYGMLSFSIGNLGYVGMGMISYINSNTIFEYNPSNNTWSQKANYGGTDKGDGMVGFSIGDKGYIAAPHNTATDLWEYTPSNLFNWSTTSNAQSIVVASTGNYALTTSNLFGCSSSTSQNLLLSPNPTVSLTGANLSCAGIASTLVAYGATSYTWSANAGGGNANTVVLNPSITTSYTVSATSGTCSSNFPVTLNAYSIPSSSIAASGPTLSCGNLTLSTNGGNNWTQKATLIPGRHEAVSFVIGNKAYVATGYNGNSSPFRYNDLWEFDPNLNTWTQKANFTGSARTGAVAMAIGNKAYMGTGNDAYTTGFLKDWFEYDPISNAWTQKNNFPGTGRQYAVAFAIGNKGYLGIGEIYTFGYPYNPVTDFWEYDPSNDTWVQKANFAGSPRTQAVAFCIGNKGYISTGLSPLDYPQFQRDLWEYDPITNKWSQKASMAGAHRLAAACFTIGTKAYIGTGYGVDNTNDVWEYNQLTDTWNFASAFPGGTRRAGLGFSIGGKGYMGAGVLYASSTVYYGDFWEYQPKNTVLWSTTSNSSAITATASGNYSVLVTSPFGCSSGASKSVSISPNPTISVSGAGTSCSGTSNTLIASGAGSYLWSSNAGGANTSSVVVTPTIFTTYTVTGLTGSCSVNYLVSLEANSIPAPSIAVSGSTLGCGLRTLTATPLGDVWTQKSSLPSPYSVRRTQAVAFAIGAKAYVGTGYSAGAAPSIVYDGFNDFWEYNPYSNAWTQKANLPTKGRHAAVGFSIGSKGYIGLGQDTAVMKDLWEYNPDVNVWTRKANFGGTPRYGSTAFVVNNKAYVATGYQGYTSNLPLSNYPNTMDDLWEYDPLLDSWQKKADFPGAARSSATGFNIGNKGYIVFGVTSAVLATDLWEYDPNNDTWSPKATFPGLDRSGAVAASIGNKAFICGGSGTTQGTELWEYNQSSNTWTKRAGFTGVRSGAVAVPLLGRIFMGTAFGTGNDEFLSYEPINSFNWSTGSTLQTISATGTNIYTVNVTSQSGCSSSTTQAVALSPNPSVTVSGYTNVACGGSTYTLLANGSTSYTWSANAGGGNANPVTVSPTISTSYSVTAATGSCVLDFPVVVNVNPSPNASISIVGSPTCGAAVNLSTSATPGNAWQQKAALNTGRQGAVAFAIGAKGYICSGNGGSFLIDLWEYDQQSNAWTQKANLPGPGRIYGIGLSLGNKGYVGLGTGATMYNDFYEYDPNINAWTQKSNFPGGARYGAAAFAIGSSIYVGTGFNAGYKNDFWAYDPSSDTWTQKSNFAGTARYGAFGFSVNNFGYVGTGSGGSNLNDLWQYNPLTDTWLSKAALGSTGRSMASVFVLANRAYVAGGNTAADFWEYNTASDVWTQNTNFNAVYKSNMLGFSVNGKGYMGTGSGPSGLYSDIWEYSPPVNILWSNGSTLTTITASASGTYSLNIGNIFGCSDVGTQVITIGASPSVSISGPSVACAGASIALSASGANNYTWSANAGGLNTSSVSVNPSGSTTYSLTAATAGCTTTLTKSVAVSASPTIGVTTSNLNVCNGGTLALSGTGAVTYTWSSGISNNTAFTPTSSSTYTVIGADNNACTNTAVVNVTVNPSPSITVNSGTLCQGQTFTLNPQGANTYTYSSGSAVVSPVSTSIYSVIGTSNAGCVSAAAAISTINVIASPIVSASGGSICAGGSFTLSPSGALTYTYSSGTNVVNPPSSASYSVYGTNASGCVNSIPAVIVITVVALPTVAVSGGTICQGQNYTLTPSGAVNYTYSGGSAVVSPTATSVYSVTGSNASGCVSSVPAFAIITVNNVPTVNASGGTICSGNSFTIAPNGASNYTYSGGSNVVSPNTSTSYTVFGSGIGPCSSAVPAVLTVSVNPSPTVGVNSGTICQGQSFTLVPSGASSYSYSSGSAIVSPAANTTYSVFGANAFGCLNLLPAIANVTVRPLPIITATGGVICAGDSIKILSAGANVYSFSGGASMVSPTATSIYSVNGTNQFGCQSSFPAVVTVSVNPLPTLAVSSGSICNGNSFTISPSGAISYTYSSGTNIVSPTVTSSYSVFGVNGNGCMNSIPAICQVTVYANPNITLTPLAHICFGDTYTINPSGASNYTYSSGSNVVMPFNTSTYTVSGLSAQGCFGSALITVSVQPSLSVAITGTLLSCAGSSVALYASGANSFTWNTGATSNSITVSPTVTSVYSLTAGSGLCSTTASHTHMVIANPNVVAVSINSMACIGEAAILIANGANTYTWNTGSNAISVVIHPTITTNYSVTGTDLNGCVNTAVVTQSVDACVGIVNVQSQSDFHINIYPNPNNGVFTVNSDWLLPNTFVEVYNAIGQRIIQQKCTETSMQISLGNAANGLYSLQVISEGKRIYTTKVIKQ